MGDDPATGPSGEPMDEDDGDDGELDEEAPESELEDDDPLVDDFEE